MFNFDVFLRYISRMTQKEFTHIASEMRRNAVSAALKYGFAPDDAEDIAQDVMLKLWCLHEKISDTARLQATSSEPIIEEKKEAPQKPSEPAQKSHQASKPHKAPQEPLLAQAEPVTEAPGRNHSEETTFNSSNPYLIVTTQLQDLRSRGERLDREVAMMIHN